MSVQLSATIGWSTTFVNYLSLTIGTNNEPAITNANNIKQIFLSVDVGPWSWNRGTISFQTVAGQQDYIQSILSASVPIFGWLETVTVQPSATITNVAGSGTIATITAANAFVAGNLVTTTGLHEHRFQCGKRNHSYRDRYAIHIRFCAFSIFHCRFRPRCFWRAFPNQGH